MAIWHAGETWGVQRLSEAQRYPDLDGLCTPILLFPHVSGQRHLLHTATLFPSLVFSATVPAPHHANKALLQSLRDAPDDARAEALRPRWRKRLGRDAVAALGKARRLWIPSHGNGLQQSCTHPQGS